MGGLENSLFTSLSNHVGCMVLFANHHRHYIIDWDVGIIQQQGTKSSEVISRGIQHQDYQSTGRWTGAKAAEQSQWTSWSTSDVPLCSGISFFLPEMEGSLCIWKIHETTIWIPWSLVPHNLILVCTQFGTHFHSKKSTVARQAIGDSTFHLIFLQTLHASWNGR